MQNPHGDKNSRFKLAQICRIVNPTMLLSRKSCPRNRIVNEILKDDFDVNHKITINIDPSMQSVSVAHLIDCTALHFLCYTAQNIDIFTTFIERGADFTIKNKNGQTVLHLIMTRYSGIGVKKENPFLVSLLSAHVKFENSTNPRDDNGLSHFHGACMADHVEAAELFLANGASVDDTVKLDAPGFSGYAPLHFAASYGSFRVAQILLERGASINAKTAKGMSPLDLLMTNKLQHPSEEALSEREEMVKLFLDRGAVSAVGLSLLHVACTFRDSAMAEQLLDEGADVDYVVPEQSPVFSGNTALHFAAENSIEATKMLLNRGAKINVAKEEKQTLVSICMAKYSLQDLSSILSCNESCKRTRLSDGKTELLNLIPTFRDLKQFKLLLESEIEDISAVVPSDSMIWPGYSILHLAVAFSKKHGYDRVSNEQQHDKTIVEECLNRGLNVNTQDVRGRTPTHLAFRQNKRDVARLLLERLNELDKVENLVDEDNLSYLHIACSTKNEALVDRLLRVSGPNELGRRTTKPVCSIEAGSTPLHVAAVSGGHAIAQLLLERGADLHATDANGMTPIHWLHMHILRPRHHVIANVLLGALSANVEDRVVDKAGLTYLHIASGFGNAEVARKLLELGSDVNAAIKSVDDASKTSQSHFTNAYSNITPLVMAIMPTNLSPEVLDVLLRRGADIFANVSNELADHMRCIPIENECAVRCFFQILWERDDMQRSMEERFGLTKLHVACYLKNKEAVKSALIDGVDVNARVNANSVIFAGCTPLHLSVTVIARDELNILDAQFTIGGVVKLLVDRGADVTIVNAEKATPIHVLGESRGFFLDRESCKDLLLNAHRDFSVNPMNPKGLSHFHLACLWHKVEIVEKFLQHGSVDINQPIDFFAKNNPGCTPLHLALSLQLVQHNTDYWTKLSQTVDLLLKHGADIAAVDVLGNTPLHQPAVLKSPELSILDKLVSYGGDVKIENIAGQTPIEELINMHHSVVALMHANRSDNLAVFQKYGYKINSWNRLTKEGYIAKIFLASNQQNLPESSEFKKFLESSDVRSIDSEGRTAIHNSVSNFENMYFRRLDNYIYVIESFVKIGIDIESRDTSGQTALHYAARMGNSIGVKALLACEADVNIVDNNGKSAFSYAVEQTKNKGSILSSLRKPSVMMILSLHLQKLQHLRVEVSQLNRNLVKEVQKFFDNPALVILPTLSCNLDEKFFSQVQVTKTLDIGTNSLTLFGFLSETGAVNLYPLLLKSERDKIDEFFKSIDYCKLEELTNVIKLQYKKMTTRLGLIDSALTSLRRLLGFSVPGLCEQVSRFLLNSDLDNLIASTTLKTRKRKLSESSN